MEVINCIIELQEIGAKSKGLTRWCVHNLNIRKIKPSCNNVVLFWIMSKETKVKVWWYNLFQNLPKPVLDTLNRIFHVFALDPVHSYFFNCRSSFAVLIYSILHCSYMLLIEFSCIYILGIVCKNCLMKYLLRSPIVSSWWVWRHQTLFSHPTHRYVWCVFSLRNRLTCN